MYYSARTNEVVYILLQMEMLWFLDCFEAWPWNAQRVTSLFKHVSLWKMIFPKRNMIEKRSYPLVIKHGNGTFLFMRMRIDTVEYWRVLEVLLMYPRLVPEKHIRIPDGKLGVDITPEWTFRKLYLATRWCPHTSPNLLMSRLTDGL